MKILLQNMETGLYLSRGGSWNNNPDLALAFLDEVRAKDYSIYHRLPHTQVVAVATTPASTTSPAAARATESVRATENLIRNTGDSANRTEEPTEAKLNGGKANAGSLLSHQLTEAVKAKTGRKVTWPKEQASRKPTPAPPEPLTIVEAKIDVGLGNTLFIRGQGGGLSWDKGLPLSCLDPTTWVWSTRHVPGKLVFKLLLNDQVWAKGEDAVVESGRKIQVAPVF